jgi:hypothetical protein
VEEITFKIGGMWPLVNPPFGRSGRAEQPENEIPLGLTFRVRVAALQRSRLEFHHGAKFSMGLAPLAQDQGCVAQLRTEPVRLAKTVELSGELSLPGDMF